MRATAQHYGLPRIYRRCGNFVANGLSFSKDLWYLWKEEFSGQFKASRYNIQHKSRLDIDNLNIIRGNMIPKIAGIELYHEIYK